MGYPDSEKKSGNRISNSCWSDTQGTGGERRHRLVLFICTGNMCRSSTAEYLFRHHMGPDLTWRASSAGISAVNGAPASTLAIELLRERGVNLTPHRSRRVRKKIVNSADLIVVMTDSHAREMIACFPEARDKIFLLKSFGSQSPGADIQDPIGLSEDVYRKTCEEINEALLDLILYLRSQNEDFLNGHIS